MQSIFVESLLSLVAQQSLWALLDTIFMLIAIHDEIVYCPIPIVKCSVIEMFVFTNIKLLNILLQMEGEILHEFLWTVGPVSILQQQHLFEKFGYFKLEALDEDAQKQPECLEKRCWVQRFLSMRPYMLSPHWEELKKRTSHRYPRC